MTSLQGLVLKQNSVAEKIAQLDTNYRKDGSNRKTISYLETKIATLKTLYSEFVATDDAIRAMQPPLDINHDYFETRRKTVETYDFLIDDMRRRLNNGPPTTPIQSTSGDKTQKPTFTSTNDMEKTTMGDGRGCNTTSPDRKEFEQTLKLQNIKMRALYREIEAAEDALAQQKPKQALQLVLRYLEKLMEQVMNLDEKINLEASEEDEIELKYFKDNYFDNCKRAHDQMVIKITTKMETYNHTNTNSIDIRLPVIEIPHFYGDNMKWKSFADTFEKLVHKNQLLTDTHRISYLKGHLGGSAARIISHLESTAENYALAWEILNNRFNNERVLAAAYFNLLINQPNLVGETAAGIRTMHDTTREAIHNINNIISDEAKFDALIIHILQKKLDCETIKIYETTLEDPKKSQSLNHFLLFLEKRFQSLEAIGNKSNRSAISNSRPQPQKAITTLAATTYKCVNCKGSHNIEACRSFLQMSTMDRNKTCTTKNLCRVCLDDHHVTRMCHIETKCWVCKGRHHTLLHTKEGATTNTNLRQQSNSLTAQNPTTQRITPVVETHMVDNTTTAAQVILSTALVKVPTNGCQSELLRILIDPGSQASFITKDAARKLNIQSKKTHVEFRGVGGIKAGVSEQRITFEIEPRFSSNFKTEISALIVNELVGNLPEYRFNAWKWPHINNLMWADPNYNMPNKIDILLGADYYPAIVLNDVIKGAAGEPIAQKTELGWIICGPVQHNESATVQCLITKTELDNRLKTFWEIEEVQKERSLTEDEQQCQEFYEKYHCRDSSGRYTVRIPFKNNPPVLGTSKTRALARFLQLEKKFAASPKFADDYKKCIKEYIELGHMQLCKGEMVPSEEYFIPHHAVIKESSTTTKLRVVFDASAKTSNNKSLNDQQLIGPTLQDELISILLRWRKHKIAFTADIEKMYRQIRVHKDDQRYQKILWRENEKKPIQEYQLTTVTFGTASAPYLAIRTLQQLATDEKKGFPIAANIVLQDFYVDDLLTGSDSIEQAQKQQQQIINLLSKGGFQIRKWASNHSSLLEQIPKESRAIGTMDIKLDETIKTLGISWNPETDTFGFKINITKIETTTKRKLLSEVSQLFDPLGWLSPTIIVAKILLQRLWLAGLSWDEPLPQDLSLRWSSYKKALPALEQIKIPRWVETSNNSPIELHGFCDASEHAYAAVIYCYQRGDTVRAAQPQLLISKTKVAPIKTKLTIPRLELCGAVLLARLMAKVIKSLQIPKTTTYAWTDSRIVLAWIKSEPHRFKTFVANRVSEIHSLSNPSTWNYIKSSENPADCASRGVEPENLAKHELWWNGPKWLTINQTNWPTHVSEANLEDLPERKLVATTKTMMVKDHEDPFDELYVRHSNLKKIQRIVSYCRRFINKLKLVKYESVDNISPQEMQEALHHLVKSAQQAQFEKEIYNLKNNKPIDNKSKLLSLTPFVKDGLLRVGGRLQNSTTWSYDEKHPIILPHSHPIVKLIIQESHKLTMHGGTQLTLAHIRAKFWIINGRNIVRQQITKCLRCHRFNNTIKNQLMGNLPEARIARTRPFLKAGVDYAGPLNVRVSKGRGNKSYKGYLAIFVCMATKAVHIEVVSDSTSEGFMAAYKRFVSRRGICTDIFSDNGTNFVGASKLIELKTSNIVTSTAEHGTKWHFIPPGTPHFGGLWEAAVKSVKYHLKRVIGETTLTFEELSTLTCQIEACLNSRPISPMTNDPSDPTFLTPGHFLIGQSTLTQPEASISEENINSLARWKLIQKMKEDFWKKWSQEYLHQLQQRAKWTTKSPNLKIGQLVLVRDKNIPPSRWITGRVEEVHPGEDGIVRVATLRGPGRVLIKRPVTKLAVLPIEERTTEDQGTELAIKTISVLSTTAHHNVNTRKRKNESNEATVHGGKKLPRIWLRGQVDETVKEAAERIKNSSPPENPKRRIRPCFQSKLMLYSMIPLLSVLGVISATFTESSFDVTPLNYTTGIYFENIGTAQLSHQQWTIISYFNISSLLLEAGVYNAAIDRMTQTCNNNNGWIHLRQLCRPAVLQMKQQLFNINTNNEIFQPTYNHTRVKRGLVNVVGTLTNQLFGILDQDDAQRYDSEISSLKSNEQNIYKLLKEQITITESTVNIIKKDFIAVNNHLQEIDKQTVSILNLIQNKENENLAVQGFMALWMHLSIEMTTFYSIQQQLIEVITDIHHSKINSLILKPNQLRNELQKLHEIIPADATIYEENNMMTLYQMMTAKVGQVKNTLIFELKMPLVNNKIYQIIKPIALPTKHKDRYAYINPSSELLLISVNRESYYPMSEDELTSCKSVRALEYICMIHNVIYNTQGNPNPCEIDLIMSKDTHSDTCQIQFMEPRNMWIPTHDPSIWIFIAERDHTINIICNKEVTTTPITGTGLITIHKACTIIDGITIIHSIENFNTRMKSFYQPMMNLSSLLRQNDTYQNMTNKIVIHPELNNILTDLNQLSTNVTHLKNAAEGKAQEINHHDVHHYILGYGIIATIIGLIIVYRCKKTTTTPASVQLRPLPRRFISTNVAREDVQP